MEEIWERDGRALTLSPDRDGVVQVSIETAHLVLVELGFVRRET